MHRYTTAPGSIQTRLSQACCNTRPGRPMWSLSRWISAACTKSRVALQRQRGGVLVAAAAAADRAVGALVNSSSLSLLNLLLLLPLLSLCCCCCCKLLI